MAIGIGIGLPFRRTFAKISEQLQAKFIAWYDFSEEAASYYINRIGSQERETISDGTNYGVIHPGRAILYDSAKTQYSRTAANQPANFRLINNSLTFDFDIRVDGIPTDNTIIFGGEDAADVGNVYCLAQPTTGWIGVYVVHSSGTVSIQSTNKSISNNKWYHITVVVDKLGEVTLWIDNKYVNSASIVGLTFADVDKRWYCGNHPYYNSRKKYLRNFRIFPLAVDRDTITKLFNREYVAGCIAWWFMEEGKESSVNKIKDSVGSNHLSNIGFDSSSWASGAWESLLNKYGYAKKDVEGEDLISGDGNFSVPTQWTFTASRFEVANGVAYFKAVDDLVKTLKNNRTISFSAGNVLNIYLDITEIGNGNAIFYIINQAGTRLKATPESFNTTGSKVITITSTVAGTGIGIEAVYTGGVYFKIDNFVPKLCIESGIIAPKMDAAIPTKDTANRDLVFFGQAKYNLLKIDTDTVKFNDYLGELFFAAETIIVNDWFNTNGVANNVDIINLETQNYRQYYGNNQLIIIKSNEVISDLEDDIIKRNLRIPVSEDNYAILKAIGTTEGTTAQIYEAVTSLKAGNAYASEVEYAPTPKTYDPTKDYIAIGWADWFTTDRDYTLPLNVKYGFGSTFYRQLKPMTNDYLNTTDGYNRKYLEMIEKTGNRQGDHTYLHISYLTSCPCYDGRTFPSNNDMRIGRADGTNIFGHSVSATVDTTLTSPIRSSWLVLSATLGAKQWQNLSDADCAAIRASLGIFGMPVDGQNRLKVLEGLDYLSNRYCGTTGYSVLNGDYSTRTPNTADGNEPSESNRIVGGIFSGASTTQNHEIWERVFTIVSRYSKEFEGKDFDYKFYATPGGTLDTVLLKKVNQATSERYQDSAFTKLANGCSLHTSSITGETRSLVDMLRVMGYVSTNAAQGNGYADGAGYDNLSRLEAQRVYKKNGIKKIDNLGDGSKNSLRNWDVTITLANQNTILSSEDVVKALYDFSVGEASYSDDTYDGVPSPFNKLLNRIVELNAWGIIPHMVNDSYTTGDGLTSYLLYLEALYQFCKRAGIEVVSHEDAFTVANLSLPSNHNYFPNPTLKTTVKTITDSSNAPVYPDGWNGGSVVDGALVINTAGRYKTRQYGIKTGDASLSVKVKGTFTLVISRITNKDVYADGDVTFTQIKSYAINEVDFITLTDTFEIPDAPMESYNTPTTPQEVSYQNYMKGYGDKWCGLQFGIVVTAGNTAYLKEPELYIE